MTNPHTARIDLASLGSDWQRPLTDRVQDALRSTLVALYRKSVEAGDEGQCYVFWASGPRGFGTEVSLLRTQEPVNVSAICNLGWQAHVLSDDDMLELFKAA